MFHTFKPWTFCCDDVTENNFPLKFCQWRLEQDNKVIEKNIIWGVNFLCWRGFSSAAGTSEERRWWSSAQLHGGRSSGGARAQLLPGTIRLKSLNFDTVGVGESLWRTWTHREKGNFILSVNTGSPEREDVQHMFWIEIDTTESIKKNHWNVLLWAIFQDFCLEEEELKEGLKSLLGCIWSPGLSLPTPSVAACQFEVWTVLSGYKEAAAAQTNPHEPGRELLLRLCSVSEGSSAFIAELLALLLLLLLLKEIWTCVFCRTTTARRSSSSCSLNCCWRPLTSAGPRTTGETR